MFKPVSAKTNFTLLEESINRLWKTRKIFEKTLTSREGGPEYVFFEGPPTANGKPGVHHVLARVFKDMFPRYKTMNGFHVSRRGGWDTHGLPVEIEVEKKHGFKNKQQIEDYGIERFNEECRLSAMTYIQEWERLTDRIGYWVNMDSAYVTFTNDYIESVWSILKSFWDKGLLYQGFKVVPYCPRCGTPLSDHEVAQGYQETEDPSVYVRMPLVDEPGTSILVWTTTPWTLPANVAVAANANVDYVKVQHSLPEGNSEKLIVAASLVEKIFGDQDFVVVERFKGKHLKGKKYLPLFTFLPLEKPAHFVVMGDFVTTDDGTGLVHIAPAFGADDMAVALKHDLPVLMTVLPDGSFRSEVRPWAGRFVKHADPFITVDLLDRGLLFSSGKIIHTYPFCWRCETPLLYYARPTWYVRTSQHKQRLVDLNQKINWYPEHIKNGRFGNWLENNIDWALGRERYWGTPLPVWECRDCHYQKCIGSLQALSEFANEDLKSVDLHRPYVDEVKGVCEKCSGVMKRVPELIDVWFDSGSMPYAQWHYPFENREVFEHQFPADFICEAVDQTRGWFYSLHAISTLLLDSEAYRNVICLGLILDGEGQKMSKSKGNVADPWEVINSSGADAMRWYLYTASPPGQERRFSRDLVSEVVRNFTLTLWNTYAFFVTYANLDGWRPGSASGVNFSPLDKWLRSSLHSLIQNVTKAFEEYDVLGATRPIEIFVDQLSNWYLRRSRRRFWKAGSDSDKHAAYSTLYEALVVLSKLLAPTMPFMAEELYQNLTLSISLDELESVHLCQWPSFDPAVIDEKLNQDMSLVMKLVSIGHSARNKANKKVRQPLSEVALSVSLKLEEEVVKDYADIIADELNVKQVRVLSKATEALSYVLNPLPKQLGQKYGSKFPKIRQVLMEMDPLKIGKEITRGKSVSIEIDHEKIEILPEEIEVRVVAKEGYAVAAEGAYVAALVTTLTPELEREGLAREFVRRVQDLRKQADLEISDRIDLYYQASEKLCLSIEEHAAYIQGETLSLHINKGSIPEDSTSVQEEFDGENLHVGLRKAG